MEHEEHNPGLLRQGLIVFIFLAFLTLVEFFIAITNQSLLLLTVVALIKGGLVMYYYMHVYKLTEEGSPDHHTYDWKLRTNRIGLWLFVLSDSFVFGGLLVTRFNLLGFTRPDLNQYLGLGVTGVLLISSFFMNRAETQIGQGDQKGFLISTAITMLLGVGFLAGVVGVEWQNAPFSVGDNAASGVFFMMTGMHAFHVLTGVVFLGIILNNGRRGLYTKEKHWGVEAATVYWHFIDLVWILFYPALYLIGRLG